MMKIQKEVLIDVLLAYFDDVNFDEHHKMDEEEWRQMLSNGYVAIYTARDEQNDLAAVLVLKSSSVNTGMWYFYSVAVNEQYRKMGLGTRLFEIATESEISTGIINSHCHVDNVVSINFHQSLGFKVVQYVPDFYGDFQDAIMWERRR